MWKSGGSMCWHDFYLLLKKNDTGYYVTQLNMSVRTGVLPHGKHPDGPLHSEDFQNLSYVMDYVQLAKYLDLFLHYVISQHFSGNSATCTGWMFENCCFRSQLSHQQAVPFGQITVMGRCRMMKSTKGNGMKTRCWLRHLYLT